MADQARSSGSQSMASIPDHRSLPEAILLWFLQVLGAVTAILFGAFGVLSWQVAGEANQLSRSANSQSDTANLVALVALCAQIATGDDVSPTTPIVSAYVWESGNEDLLRSGTWTSNLSWPSVMAYKPPRSRGYHLLHHPSSALSHPRLRRQQWPHQRRRRPALLLLRGLRHHRHRLPRRRMSLAQHQRQAHPSILVRNSV